MKDSPQKPKWLKKAYNNIDFLNSPAARPLRILSEMLEPADRLRKHHIHNTVVFFGSARALPPDAAEKNLVKFEALLKARKKASAKLIHQYEHARRALEVAGYYKAATELSQALTLWFNKPENKAHRFMVASGGGPGIMEAAGLGALKAKGESIGLNISLPHEQEPNLFQTKELSFEFHYFFIRKFWFLYLAKGLVFFPGGFGTLDELFELLTLIQTKKSRKYMPIVLFGSSYWKELINFDLMIRNGMIDAKDAELFKMFDSVKDAFHFLKEELTKHYFKDPPKTKF